MIRVLYSIHGVHIIPEDLKGKRGGYDRRPLSQLNTELKNIAPLFPIELMISIFQKKNDNQRTDVTACNVRLNAEHTTTHSLYRSG